MKKVLLFGLVLVMCSVWAFARASQDQGSAGGVIQVTIPHYKSGENVGGQFFLPQVERFNQKYAGQYRLIIEELVQDMYNPRLQQLSQVGRLPALIESGFEDWIKEYVIPNNMFVDMRDVYNNTPDIRNHMAAESVAYNTHNGKLFSITSPVVRPIGLYYNPALYTPSRPISQMSWEQLAAELGDNKIAFMTGENAWTTVLTLASLIASEPGGADWWASGVLDNPRHTDFNNPIMINAITRLQRLLQNNASANTIGAVYADAANAFMSNRSAIIVNGSWMVGDFAPANSSNWSNGFNGANVRGDALPGNVGVGGPAVGFGWWIPNTATPQEQELAKAFVAFMMTQDELERFMIVEGGSVPTMNHSASYLSARSQNRLLAEYDGAFNASSIMVYGFSSAVPSSIADPEFGRLLPLLINGTYTPAQFCQELTTRARETLR